MRATLTVLFVSSVFPTASLALCSGASIEAYLPADVLAEVERTSDATLNGKGLIWRADRDGDQITFFGSLHIYDPRLLPLRYKAREALDGADVLLVEQTTEQLQEMQRELLADPSLILLPEGQTLIGMIDDASWELLAEAGRARGLPSPMTARFQPWYLVAALGTPPCAMPDIQAGLTGLDAMVMEDAASLGVETRALEDWRDSLRILYDDPIDAQIDMLEMSLLPPDIESALFASTFDAYFAYPLLFPLCNISNSLKAKLALVGGPLPVVRLPLQHNHWRTKPERLKYLPLRGQYSLRNTQVHLILDGLSETSKHSFRHLLKP